MPRTPSALPDSIAAKLAAFATIEADFIASFAFIEAMHGQMRFDALTVDDAVRYLHACYLCDCKDRLLSVTRTIPRYGGEEALRLLAVWQVGDSAPVIAALHERLDSQPFVDLTRQWQVALAAPDDGAMSDRLFHGRLILLNRALNQARLFEAIFVLSQAALMEQVRDACTRYGHTPEALGAQAAAFSDPAYAFVPHHALVKRNITVMNALGMATLTVPADLPGDRTWRVATGEGSRAPFAETPIPAYTELTAPLHNNPRHVPFTERPDTAEDAARSHAIVVETITEGDARS